MATKFLDYTGLSYLWSKIKEWCSSIFVTKATDENITGTKTFVGSKKIIFKQNGANDKLGFTLFNNSGNEQGYLEYNPTNKIAGVPLMTLGNYATAANELTYVGFRRYSNISGASGAYNLLTPLISDAKSHFNLTTTYTNFYLPLGISDGTNVVTADNGGVININSLLPTIPTIPVLSRTVSGSGNAITDITVSGHAITVTKGSTFLTSHQSLDGKMTRGVYERIDGSSSAHKDLNDYIDAGFYNVKTQFVDNCPTNIDIDAVLLVYPWNFGSYCTQEITESAASGDVRRWIRKLNNTIWSAWKQVAFTNTTLAGYGITDAKITNGTITLGSNSITPLTDDSNYVHLTGAETITGSKTLNSFLNFKDANVFIVKNNDTVNNFRYLLLQSGDWNVGSRLQLMDNDSVNDKSYFLLSSGTKILKGSPDGTLDWPGSFGLTDGSANIGLYPASNRNHGGYIDFHYNGDSSDYTSRIIETQRGLLNVNGVVIHKTMILGGIEGYTMPFIQGISDTVGNGNSMVYTCGQYSISDMYAGSSTNPQVISFPVNGTNDISNTDKANVQNLRLGWNGSYFHDLFVSPNNAYVWHRNVIPNLARGWRRIVEENISGVTSPNWNISIAGNAATATTLATARTIFGQSFDGSANIANCNVYANGVELKGDSGNGGYVDFHFNNASDDYTSRFIETQSGRITAYCELFIQNDPDKNMLAQIRINRGPRCFMFRNDGSDFYLLKTADNDTLGSWDSARPFRVDGSTGLCSINVITPLANSNDNNAANTAWVRTYHSSSSDKRVKQDFADVPNDLLDVWENITWQQYKLINEVKESGDTAPLRFGIVVQDVQEIFKDNNIDPDQYGFMYHLKYQGTDGDEPTEDNPEITKADKWYLNYNEALSIEAAYQRRKNKVLERRISELETQVENMLQVLESLKGA